MAQKSMAQLSARTFRRPETLKDRGNEEFVRSIEERETFPHKTLGKLFDKGVAKAEEMEVRENIVAVKLSLSLITTKS